MDIAQPFSPCGDMRAQGSDHCRDLIAHIALFLARTDRDRRHCGKTGLGPFVPVAQVAPHSPAAPRAAPTVYPASPRQHAHRLVVPQPPTPPSAPPPCPPPPLPS